ncbi:hypothetical protein KSP40_PGU003400 [Platanthera guangdongensis]|uniref:Uncharacterized protein n=1 Tax=Platanthera guangdongensis TaxID=2320717 RepID=A0ABR2M506_9ASPA
MRSGPHINAGKVKCTVALWEQANRLAIMKFPKANGAVDSINEAFTGFVNPGSDRRDGNIVKPVGSDVPDMVIDLVTRWEIFTSFVLVNGARIRKSLQQ